jgi:hypothetical protein
MGFLGFLFDYGPKTFVDKTPRDILNMVSTKVTDNFDEKYKDNEEYKQLSDNKKEAIFLLRVLKKGLKPEDKDRVLSLCGIDKEEEQPRRHSEPTRVPSMQPRHSAIKPKTLREPPMMKKQEPKANVDGQANIDVEGQADMEGQPKANVEGQANVEDQPKANVEGSDNIDMEGGKRKKTRRRRNRRKGSKKTKRQL